MAVAKKDKKKDKNPDTIPHEGRYQFNDSDKIKLGDSIAEQYMKRITIDTELKKVKSEFKAKLDACDSKIQKITEKISNGHEPRMFDCIVEKDFENDSVRYIDVQTNNVVEERKMTPHEHQIGIGDNVIDENNANETGKVDEDKPENAEPNPEAANQ